MDLIIGAGITGLSYAAYSNNDYMIIEKEHEIGGYCRTIHQDGFVWDYSGHFFHFQDEKIKQDVMSHMDPSQILSVTKKTQIKYRDLMIDYPFQKNIHQLHKEEFIDCLYDLFQNPYHDYSSFKEMLYAKFGKSIAEKFLIPYNEKLYACDLNSLDVDAMGRFFPFANKDDIILNFKFAKEQSYNAHFLYPRGGAIEYVKSVCGKVKKDRIFLNEELLDIDVYNKIAYTNKRRIKYDNIISTIPFPYLLKQTHIDYDKSLYTSNQVLVFNIGFNKKGLERVNNWIYFPEKKYLFYRIGFYDNIFQSDKLSVYVEIGYRENDIIDPDKALQDTLIGMKKAGIISDHEIESMCTLVMNPAYVHVTKNMEIDKLAKMKLLNGLDIYSIGRYGSWIYCSIEDNIKEAKTLAHQLESR